jgi:alpha-L-rhamnosidase
MRLICARRGLRKAVRFLALLGLSGACVAASLRPAQLRCEHLEDPAGIDAAEPRLSWVLEPVDPAVRGTRQTAYQVQVASSAARLAGGEADRWDSGQVASDQSVLVRYAGERLGSGQECYWRVRVWDERGQASDWSAAARWTMGLLGADDWRGVWIGKDETTGSTAIAGTSWIWHPEGDPATAAPPEERFFRQRFEIAKDTTVQSARWLVVADNEFVAYVNGRVAGQGGNFQVAAELDVAGLLAPGPNVLAVKVRNVGTAPNPAGLLARLEVVAATGERAELVTDETWRTSRAAGTGWERPDYNHGGWQRAKVLGPAGMAPWGAISGPEDRRLAARHLRKEFRVEKKVRRATAYVSGLGWSELYLNGRKVGDDVLSPGLTDYAKRVFYVTHEVTDVVRRGNNCVGVVLGNGRFFAPRLTVPTETRTFGFPKLRFQLHLEYADGTEAVVVSDGTWKLTAEGPITANNEYDGEAYDARRELGDWAAPGYDDRAWDTAQSVAAPAGRLVAEMIPPRRVIETRRPLARRELSPGVWIYDFGQNLVGWCRLSVQGRAGTVLRLRHAETLRPDGTLDLDSLRGAKATDTYTLKGRGQESYEPRFTCHGFRYVELRGYPDAPGPDALEARVASDALTEAGAWSSSNPLLDRIHQNVVWGLRGNYRSIPTDCPQRDERQGWLGDRAEASRGESFLFHNAALYAKWVQDMADAQLDSGSLPDVCPPYWPVYTDNVTWPAAFVLIPGHLWTQFGDADVLRRHYPAMQRWVEYMAGFLRDDLMPRDTYGDWGVPPEDPGLTHAQDPGRVTHPVLLGTAAFAHGLTRLAAYADALGRPDDARAYRDRAGRLQTALNARFLDPARGGYDNGSPTSSVLPLAYDLVPEESRDRVVAHLVQQINDGANGHLGTGVVGGQWLLRTLTAQGRVDLAYRIASNRTYPSWGYMVERGATTLWELWNADTASPAVGSGNHVMLVGDLVLWLYEDLAGIRADPARPGFKHILMKPHPVGDLTHVQATHRSPYGWIRSTWRAEWPAEGAPGLRPGSAANDRGAGPVRFVWDIEIPPNTTATLQVPAVGQQTVTESGRPAAEAVGLRLQTRQQDRVVFEAVPGRYTFEVR